MFKRIFILICLLVPFFADAQEINSALLQKPWKAHWITIPADPAHPGQLQDYGVYKFRKQFELAEKPASFVVHVSADNRYKLFVNGKQVGHGPARGDLYFWNFETIDIAPYLQTGKNTLAALVWNEGLQKPLAQISNQTAFILQGNTVAEELVNTDKSWRVIQDESYVPLPVKVPGYYVAGPGQFVDMNRNISGWETNYFTDTAWKSARVLDAGLPKQAAINATGWMLVPSAIPQMEMTMQRLRRLRKVEGLQVPTGFPAEKVRVAIPANTSATLLLDQEFLTNAYPTLIFSRGKNARITMGYAEALFKNTNVNLLADWLPNIPKGNRNEIDGKMFLGRADSIISNGRDSQEYTALAWRTYRYIQLKIETKDEPLVLEDIYGTFTGYPFQQTARFESTDTSLNKILEIGWRTARLCATETYMDCPYYEQLQYIGDARIQAMVTLYNSSDDRLVRNALDLMDHSRIAEGITLSRYPGNLDQQIPTFSLWWIGMLHDYWMYRPDYRFVQSKLPGARQVLSFFERYQQPDGSLKHLPYWVFTDWVDESNGWDFGMAPIGKNGESAVLDLQLLWTYQLAAAMERELGLMDLYTLYSGRAAKLKQTIQSKYWVESRQLFADTETKDLFSQHTNALAILTGVMVGNKATALAKKILADTSLAPASIYFKYYVHQALIKAGLGDDYLSWLDKWRENIDMGLTTWAEISNISMARSDCHAWGSSPNIEFYRAVLGIDSDGPGFTKVIVAPHLGSLTNASGEMPHPNGKISVEYKKKNGYTGTTIHLPAGTNGILKWKGERYLLKAGINHFQLK